MNKTKIFFFSIKVILNLNLAYAMQ